MSEENNRDEFLSLIENSNKIAVIPSKIAGKDAFFAAVSLFHMISDLERDVALLYPGKIPDDTGDVIREEQVTKDVRGRSLIVSIDYSDTPAANVHYTTENDVLHLRLAPVPDNYDKDTKVRAEVMGNDYDLVIILGAPDVDEIGWNIDHLGSPSDNSKIINIDISGSNNNFGHINIVDRDITSICLLVMQNSPKWGLKANEKAAKSLLKGILHREPDYRNA